AQYVVPLDLRRQRDRALDHGARALRRLDDLQRRLVDQLVVERLEPDADALVVHVDLLSPVFVSAAVANRFAPPDTPARLIPDSRTLIPRYSMILATTPAPTVRPPSRIANRSPSSIAIGWISVTVIPMLSPGITISVPAGSSQLPVTSVVRK